MGGCIVGLTVIIVQISLRIVLNWNWPIGTELGKSVYLDQTTGIISVAQLNVTDLSIFN